MSSLSPAIPLAEQRRAAALHLRARLARSRRLRIAYRMGRALPEVPATAWLDLRRTRAIARVIPDTMVAAPRLMSAYECARAIEAEGLEGSIVECGVWTGGCAALMAIASAEAGGTREVHLFDSFEGLPQPSPWDVDVLDDFRAAHADLALDDAADPSQLVAIGACAGAGPDEVRDLLVARHGIDPARLVMHVGWFQETVPAAAATMGPIALLRLDGDWYESTRVCLEHLYDLVVPGGVVSVDDYGEFVGCARAVDEFLAGRGADVVMHRIDRSGVVFRKP